MSSSQTRMRFGIALQTNKTPREYIAQAQLIDRYPFDVVSVYNDLFFQPSLGPLTVMAPHLQRAVIGPAALNPYTVHPVEIAGQIAFLDLLTHGRAYLSLARGTWLDAIGIQQTRPLARLREAILTVQRLLSDGSLRYPVARQSVPITLGTWGPRTARLAGELADEIKIGGSANPFMAGYLRPYLDEGGRDVGICLGAVTVVDPDRTRARLRARQEVALYAPVVAPLDPTLNDPEWLSQLALSDDPGRLISDEALDKLAFAGTPNDLVRKVEDLAAAGVTRIEFGTPHGLDSREGIRLLGEQVLPSFV